MVLSHPRRISTEPSKTKSISLGECLSQEGLFSTGAFPRVEVKERHGVQLINQQDIFDSIIKGKWISKRGVKLNSLVEEDEIIIAGVGTLGETETFCRCVYANEYLAGKLVSGEFIRLKTNTSVPSGYLYLWLSSQYGFRMIRNTQAGTKLCRPIKPLLEDIPVPIIDKSIMEELDGSTKYAQKQLSISSNKEQAAIDILESIIQTYIS